MKTTLACVAALLLGSYLSRADATNNVPPAKIGTAVADRFYDKEMIVTGTVAQVTFRPSVVFVNLDKAFPNTPFCAVIFQKNTNQFGDLQSLEGKAVEIKGTIKEFHDKPEIVLESTNQLAVITGGK